MGTNTQVRLRRCNGEAEWLRLVEIWRSAVEATHDFLSAADIDAIERQLPQTYLPNVEITVAETPQGIAGFSGLAAGKLEMIFVDANFRGAGVGSALLRHAVAVHPNLSLDVNEQNLEALGFYLHHGFRVVGRSTTDEAGRPFPLLHLALGRPEVGEMPVVIVVMGATGTGKSTLAAALATSLAWEFQEGDDLHPASNIAKMAAGEALSDDDREPWLDRISAWIETRLQTQLPAVITCSALKRQYRDRLAAAGVAFVHLNPDRETIANRLAQRTGHFMDASLLESQLELLEPLASDEVGLVVDGNEQTGPLAASVIGRLGLTVKR
ncbi:MAG: acetyltransferase [Propionicimonas sp.]|uniref:acetyltransferase n=1 Tax=Propionicimonas sp. TaxID=1955623 RepID=UPI0025CDA1F6|nr:acetyltransferase [Propionicimonas sp.]MCG2806601.1 acetyltransferase [Propionicimonas sp.]